MRALFVVGLMLLFSRSVSAQDAGVPSPTEAAPTVPESAEPATAEPATDAPGEEELVLRAPAPDPVVHPKVALVLVGDPDDRAVAALDALTAQLEGGEVVRMPSDAALRRALSGRGTDDGLDDVRSERRGLGLSERRDIPVLSRLGRLATASAIVVVRAAGEGHEAVVLDVTRGAFFDGTLTLPAAAEDARAFIGRRARAAARAVEAPEGGPTAAASETVVPSSEAVVPEAPADAESAVSASLVAPAETPPGDPVLQWFEQNWAYLAAGALLAGGIAFVAVVATDSGGPQPMLRFVPGEL